MAPGTHFQPVLPDITITDPTKVKRVMFVSGKIYYELVKERASRGKDFGESVAIVRVEELCPTPIKELQEVIGGLGRVEGTSSEHFGPVARYIVLKDPFAYPIDWMWVQEEPQNQGAYTFIQPRLERLLPACQKVFYVNSSSTQLDLSDPSCSSSSNIMAVHHQRRLLLESQSDTRRNRRWL